MIACILVDAVPWEGGGGCETGEGTWGLLLGLERVEYSRIGGGILEMLFFLVISGKGNTPTGAWQCPSSRICPTSTTPTSPHIHDFTSSSSHHHPLHTPQ